MGNSLAGKSRHSLEVRDQSTNWYTAMREIQQRFIIFLALVQVVEDVIVQVAADVIVQVVIMDVIEKQY